MPIGPYADFGACVTAQKRKGKSDVAAHKICGYIEAQVRKSREMSTGETEKMLFASGHIQMPDGRWLRLDSVEFADYPWNLE